MEKVKVKKNMKDPFSQNPFLSPAHQVPILSIGNQKTIVRRKGCFLIHSGVEK
jgi:hypothetical protein